MKSAVRTLLAFASLVLASPDAHAFKVDEDGHGHELHWKNGAATYYMASNNNPAGAAGEAAIHDAFKAWSDSSSNLTYTFAGYTSQPAQAYDGKNVVYWVSGAWPYDSTMAAVTYRYFDTTDGRILDADIVFRGTGINWTVGGSGYDIENAATHEVGHFTGLGHSTDAQATMYASTRAAETQKRDLAADDLSGLAAIYGGVGTTTTPSSVAKNDRIGVYRPSNGVWYLDKNGNGAWNDCAVDGCLGEFGASGDQPVVGRWSGAERSEIAVFRASAGTWALDSDADGVWDGCAADGCVSPYGAGGDIGVAGDWGNWGASAVGVFRPAQGWWYLDANGNGRWDGCSIDRCNGPFGLSTDLPVVGDWTGSGVSRIGVYRPSDGRWYLDKNGDGQWSGCTVDACLGPFGIKGDRPVVGDWTGTGVSSIGVYRPSDGRWYLDLDGKGQWSGCTTDACLGPFGMPGDVPVVGKW